MKKTFHRLALAATFTGLALSTAAAQGNLRDNAGQAISFYGGVDRLAKLVDRVMATA